MARSAFELASAASNVLRIDPVEDLSFPHERALGEGDLLEEALHASADLDVLGSLGLAHELHLDRHVLLDDGGDHHLRRSRGRRGLLFLAPGGAESREDQGRAGGSPGTVATASR